MSILGVKGHTLTASYMAAYSPTPVVVENKGAGNGHVLLRCALNAVGAASISVSYLSDSHILRISEKGGSELTGFRWVGRLSSGAGGGGL